MVRGTDSYARGGLEHALALVQAGPQHIGGSHARHRHGERFVGRILLGEVGCRTTTAGRSALRGEPMVAAACATDRACTYPREYGPGAKESGAFPLQAALPPTSRPDRWHPGPPRLGQSGPENRACPGAAPFRRLDANRHLDASGSDVPIGSPDWG